MKKITLSLLIALSVILYSCKDETDDQPQPNTSNFSLTGTTWVVTAATVDPPIDFFGVEISDLYAEYDDCDKDDLTIFDSDSTYTSDEGATKCDPDDPQTIGTGTWSISADKKTLTMDDEVFTIQSMTSAKMVVTYPYYDETEDKNYTFTFTYTRK